MNYQDYDLIITTNYVKKELLKKISREKIISKVKIITKSELSNMLFEIDRNKSIIFLVEKYNYSYEHAKVVLKNIFYKGNKLNHIFDDLLSNNLVRINDSYILMLKKVLLLNVFLDDFYKNLFTNAVFEDTSYEKIYSHDIYEYKNIFDEVTSLAFKILKLNLTDYSNVKIVNAGDDYKPVLKKIFKMFNIPVNLDEKNSIYKMKTCTDFLINLKLCKDITLALENLDNDLVYDKIINYLNSNDFDEINDLSIKIIEDDLKSVSLTSDKIKNAVDLINLEDVISDNKYYFIVGFNEGSIPTYYKDEDYYSDKDKETLGLFTSLNKNINFKKQFERVYFSTKNLNISYKLKTSFTRFTPSYYINEYNLNVINEFKNDYSYSTLFNKITLARYIDDLTKFGEKHNDLDLLYTSYDLRYLDYDNSFSGINNELYNSLNEEITLSYSSVKDYYECGFKYYVSKVLKLNLMEESLAIIIGNAFHFVLSKMYQDDFNFDDAYEESFKECDLSNKDLLFKDILKSELKLVIDYIIDFETVTSLKENILEEGVTVQDVIPGKVKLYGIIDKFKINNEKNIGIVVDYKTGSVSSNLANVNHGFNLQLPIYIYLAKNAKPNLKIGGFYLQKVLSSLSLDEDVSKKLDKFKLDGYSTNDEDVLREIDSGYAGSRFIKSMKLSNNGFSTYAKVLDEFNIDKLSDIAYDKVKSAAKSIVDGKFDINPKKISGKNVSCEFCKYKDLCFMKEENVVELENTPLKDIL